LADYLTIINEALDILGEPRFNLTNPQDGGHYAVCLAAYERVRDIELNYIDWQFAVKRVKLLNSATAPVFGWAYAFDLPIDCVRFLPLTDTGDVNGCPVSYVYEGNKILCNKAELNLRYISKQDVVDNWSLMFRRCVITGLARAIAQNIVGMDSLIKNAEAQHMEARALASTKSAQDDGLLPPSIESHWLTNR
jgi:hypothetical protein